MYSTAGVMPISAWQCKCLEHLSILRISVGTLSPLSNPAVLLWSESENSINYVRSYNDLLVACISGSLPELDLQLMTGI
ncbi:hypothetical protein A2U01_0023578, partial [Trifolium medium]|nr:hypothetical protein [Trifolium medium]